MNRLTSVLMFLVLLISPMSAHAQQSSITLHGVRLICPGASGQKVPLYQTERARVHAGGYASYAPGKGATLELWPPRLNSLQPLPAFFVFFHECGHVALPFGKGLIPNNLPLQERNADCWAVREMQRRGLISSWNDFREATRDLYKQQSSNKGHLPGPVRVKQAAQCANIPIMSSGSSVCRTLDRVFVGGTAFLKRYDFDNKKLFKGLFEYCEKNDDDLYCIRRIKGQRKRTSFANNLANKVRSCLPSDFKHEKSTSMPEFSHDWENVATGHSVSVFSDYIGEVTFVVTFPKK